MSLHFSHNNHGRVKTVRICYFTEGHSTNSPWWIPVQQEHNQTDSTTRQTAQPDRQHSQTDTTRQTQPDRQHSQTDSTTRQTAQHWRCVNKTCKGKCTTVGDVLRNVSDHTHPQESKGWNNTGRKEMFYLTTHSTHFIYGYMASDIW